MTTININDWQAPAAWPPPKGRRRLTPQRRKHNSYMRWTPAVIKAVSELKAAGWTHEQIGRAFGVTKRSISAGIRQHIRNGGAK